MVIVLIIIFKINNLTRNVKPFQRALCPKVESPGTELLLYAKYCSKKDKYTKHEVMIKDLNMGYEIPPLISLIIRLPLIFV